MYGFSKTLPVRDHRVQDLPVFSCECVLPEIQSLNGILKICLCLFSKEKL